MQQSLFRPNAIEHQKDRLHGSVMVVPSLSHVMVTLLGVLWCVVVLAWLVSSHYARHETVSGWLEPPEGIIKVFANSSQGQIKQLLVHEGQRVSKGQSLLIIDDERTLPSGLSLQAALLAQYATQQRLLTEERQRVVAINQVAVKDLASQSVATTRTLQAIDAQIQVTQQRQQLLEKRLTTYSSVRASGHIAAVELDKLNQQKLALISEVQALLRDQATLRNQLEQVQNQRLQLPQIQQNNLAKLDSRLSELALKVATLEGQQAYIIKAERDGIISNLQVKQGQQVDPSVPLFAIVPPADQIAAKLLIPVRAVGFVEKSQKITIRYDAFPFQKFGLYHGVITQISDAIMLPNEVHSAPFALKEPAYLVRATLQSQSVLAYGKSLPLKSGMTLSADIQLGQRSLLEWLFEPLISLQGRMQ